MPSYVAGFIDYQAVIRCHRAQNPSPPVRAAPEDGAAVNRWMERMDAQENKASSCGRSSTRSHSASVEVARIMEADQFEARTELFCI